MPEPSKTKNKKTNMDVSSLPLMKRPLKGLSPSCGLSKKQRGRPTSVCGVCGDEAKHIHFGGLCCPSCKAFFRRVVQLNIKDSLSCALSSNCEITVKNRRDCPACRFKKCKNIGMLLTWVMPEEERKRMMERRIVASKRIMERMEDDKELDSETAQHSETVSNEVFSTTSSNKVTASSELSPLKDHVNSAADAIDPKCETNETVSESPKVAEMKEIFIKQEIKVEDEYIESTSACITEEHTNLSLTLSEAFTNSDFLNKSSLDETDKFSQIFFSYCKVLSVFFHSIEDLQALKIDEKSKMIKYAVTKSIFLYGTHQFDNASCTFPRFKLNSKCTFPTIKLQELELFIANEQVFLEIKNFLTTQSGILEDECLTLYLMVISFLTMDDRVSETATELKRKYCKRFEDYISNQKEINGYKSAQYYYDILLDADKLAKVFGEMKLPANKIAVESGLLQNLGNSIKLEPEESYIVQDHTESHKNECEVTLKTISLVQSDHDYSMAIKLDESNCISQHKFSPSFGKNKDEKEPLQQSSWKLKHHRHPFYQKPLKSCNRSCCSETNSNRKPNISAELSNRHLEYRPSCSPEYQRHVAYHHTSNFEVRHPSPERTICSQIDYEKYKCYRKYQCCSSPSSPFHRYGPIWNNCTILHHRWSHHYHPNKETRPCCHIPWDHGDIDRCLHNSKLTEYNSHR